MQTRDIRNIFPSPYLKASDLDGDVMLTITKIEKGVVGHGKNDPNAAEKPLIHFLEHKKPLACNITNANIIGGLLGTFDPDDWIGQQIILYATTTEYGGKVVDCIRVRPKGYVPQGTAAGNGKQALPVQRPKANPFPPATVADEIMSDEAFVLKLSIAFRERKFTDEQMRRAVNEYCRQKTIPDIYGLSQQERTELLNKVVAARFDRYRSPSNGMKLSTVA